MDEQQRDRSLDTTGFVNEVDVERIEPFDVNIHGELRHPIDFRLLFPPVEAVSPVIGETLDVAQRRTGLGACIFQLLWEIREIEFLVEPIDLALGDIDLERFYGRCHIYQFGRIKLFTDGKTSLSSTTWIEGKVMNEVVE